jgi:hypothetical protein
VFVAILATNTFWGLLLKASGGRTLPTNSMFISRVKKRSKVTLLGFGSPKKIDYILMKKCLLLWLNDWWRIIIFGIIYSQEQ